MRLISKLCKASVQISNLAWHTSRKEIWDHFSKYGPLVATYVYMDRYTAMSTGGGEVVFKDEHGQKKALQELQHIIDGRHINVSEKQRFKNIMGKTKILEGEAETLEIDALDNTAEHGEHSDRDSEEQDQSTDLNSEHKDNR